MKATVAILSIFLTATSANAKGLADRAAEVFEKACLSKPVLALGNGSNAGDGAAAVNYVGDVFAQYDAKGKAKGLAGRPTYKLSSSRTQGKFSCHVSSKDLTARDVVKRFNRLVKIAGSGAKPTFIGPAKFDDDPNRFIKGKRAEFESEGRKLQLELFYYKSAKGPVGSLFLTLEHKASR
ncbi:hypothetical protein [uncultured Aliiroseovarius sp.]|uniref:hypothetical protein n=1 Tax=uncultured Aliiroseovarius sp. TaxID=1658783 RepID=UPI0026138D07|nr:hypothetical protein [uncultured Aliiroseovarius sp.]